MNHNANNFENNEFEMALITYKRASFVDMWLKKCIDGIVRYNIMLSVYDSSDDDDTCNIIREYNSNYNGVIEYVRLPSSTTGGYKYIPPILETKSKYIMIVGDSRYHLIDDLVCKVVNFIKEDKYDVISFSYFNNEQYQSIFYDNCIDFIHDCFVSLTCCGMTIFKTKVFCSIRDNLNNLHNYDKKYKELFGFAYMGYYLETLIVNNCNAIMVKIPWYSINPQKKVQHWNKRFYECWCDELCKIMDYLPKCSLEKDEVLRKTWLVMKLDGFDDLYKAKMARGLTMDDFNRMMNNGFLHRVTVNIKRFKIVAKMPSFIITPIYNSYRILRKISKIVRKTNHKEVL